MCGVGILSVQNGHVARESLVCRAPHKKENPT